jgi:hypothetical protein
MPFIIPESGATRTTDELKVSRKRIDNLKNHPKLASVLAMFREALARPLAERI